VFPPTFTPTQPGAPTAAPTPRPSRTPPGTATLAPTLAPSATPPINIELASAENQPAFAGRLLYFEGGRVMLWDSLSGTRQPLGAGALPGDLTHYTVSAGGTLIAVARAAPGGAEILIYNRPANGVVRAIPLPGMAILHLALSPDGTWLAYTAAQIEPTPTPGATATPAPTLTPTVVGSIHPTITPTPTATPTGEPALDAGAVYLARLSDPAAPRLIAACDQQCTAPLWSPPSDYFVYGDKSGLWGADPLPGGGTSPQLILDPVLSGLSGSTETRDGYLPLAFSPSGRFILVRKGLTTGAILAVVDRPTRLAENIPAAASHTGVAWLSGDLLFITRKGDDASGGLPYAQVWAVTPGTGAGMFTLGGVYPLPGTADTLPAAPAQLPDGRISLTLINFRDANDVQTNGLYLLDLAAAAVKLNVLPFMQVRETYWFPDLTAALVVSDSRTLYVPANGGQIYSITNFLGSGACCWLWLP
jgi:hypothetical protein